MKQLLSLALIFAITLSACKSGSKNSLVKTIAAERDSVTKENSELKKLLAKKFESLCDTAMTIEERLAWQTYEEFKQQAYSDKEKIKDSLSDERRKVKDTAYNQKSKKTTESYVEEAKSLGPIYQEWEKNGNQSFVKYAVLKFYSLEVGYNFDGSNYDQRIAIEQSTDSVIKKTFTAVGQVKAKKKAINEAAEGTYKQACAEADNVYKLAVENAEAAFEQKCKDKRIELGLE